MTFNARKILNDVTERHEHISTGHDKLVPLAAAIIAVLAALGTLFAHHRSIAALSVKNEAILAQARASDLYNFYQARRTRFTVYSALLAADTTNSAKVRDALRKTADREHGASLQTLNDAQALERTARTEQERSESILQSFETLEIGTTLFEIAIVFVSISALSRTRILLYFAGGMTLIGSIYLIVGLLQSH